MSPKKKQVPRKAYVIFKRIDGRLVGLAEGSFHLYWSTDKVMVFRVVPTSAFKPQEGHFIVRCAARHDDIELFQLDTRCYRNIGWREK